MIRLLPLLIPFALIALIEWSVIGTLGTLSGDHRYVQIVYMVIAGLGYLGIVLAIAYWRARPINRSSLTNFLIGLGFATVVQKLLAFVGLTIYRLVCSVGWTDHSDTAVLIIFSFTAVPFLAMIYGILWGKYRYVVERTKIVYDELPTSFDGFKIVQISDVHSGTWDSVKGVERGIKLIEEQDPDIIVFTGDLVNSDKEEINPFMHLFGRLKAPHGKYAILGNHDYYGQPREKDQRQAYYNDFFSKYEKMGFDLILNDSRAITRGDDALSLIGVENWGSGRYFPKRGDLDLATQKVKSDAFSILLSHDPSHWDLKALTYGHHFHLTLSGHTHGMQFGINLPFFKWSPVQYRYKQWMGLYEKAGQFLYVNRGFGLLAYPGRVGMSPEVTLITLRSKEE